MRTCLNECCDADTTFPQSWAILQYVTHLNMKEAVGGHKRVPARLLLGAWEEHVAGPRFPRWDGTDELGDGMQLVAEPQSIKQRQWKYARPG